MVTELNKKKNSALEKENPDFTIAKICSSISLIVLVELVVVTLVAAYFNFFLIITDTVTLCEH